MIFAVALAVAMWFPAPPREAVTGTAAADGGLVALGEPVRWCELDAAKLKGRPARLAWSDDRSELYLQIVDGATAGELKFRHYIVRKGSPPKAVDSQPKWVEEYW